MPKAKKSTQAPSPETPLAWPVVSRKDYVEAEVLEQDQIIVIADFLSPDECASFARFVAKQALTTTPPAKRGEADRVNDRISIQSENFAQSLYRALEPHVSHLASFQTHLSPAAQPVALNQNIRLYRYSDGQYFGPHYDDSISYTTASGENIWSEWTLLVYLTGVEDGVVGGETIFYKPAPKKKPSPPPIVPSLNRGTALLHRHGKECMLHEGALVQSGTKLVLRSDLMFSQAKVPNDS
ncbi:hypothetical protein DL93DRAFT_2130800 [Clavulina sp. PMI_390]|nr:hypothetical protein DL93DRAFT_2130800 [Clavulina sp. PMI_390]